MMMMLKFLAFTILVMVFAPFATAVEADQELETRLALAAENRAQIQLALDSVPTDQRSGMEFLIRHMPERDLRQLSAEFLLENCRLAYQSRQQDPWAKEIPEEIFLNDVLPYASINERRDAWRADFRKRFLPLVSDAKSTSEVASRLNQQIFSLLGVRYSTQRKKADQSPYESIEGGTASCTGLSVLLIDACRAVGVPARMVGTPLWSNNSGNHSWVEVWDQGWHFTGAAEPTGQSLDQGWFVGRAADARRDQPIYAIYATSFRQTPLSFPCVWDRDIKYIPAVNVTDRYTALRTPLPDDHVRTMFVVRSPGGERLSVPIEIIRDGESIFSGTTNDDRFDANDHLTIPLQKNRPVTIRVEAAEAPIKQQLTPVEDQHLVTIIAKTTHPPEPEDPASDENLSADESNAEIDPERSGWAIDRLREQLQNGTEPIKIREDDFSKVPLTKEDAKLAREILAAHHANRLVVQRKEEWENRTITSDSLKMPFSFKTFGEKPADGWSLYISLHGGGNTRPEINDRQWENQKRLYSLEEGIYVAPRAPTDTWNLWHQAHIDTMLVRLIEDFVVMEDVNWNRVYLMGYSAGGDGVYQLAPRMADRFAAAAMMAGHPNETSPLGLRNLPFALQVGGKDSAYRRNEIAGEWEKKLDDLRQSDPGGYEHLVKVYPDKGHWMDREDAVAIPWMKQFTRNPTPQKIVWKQDDVLHANFYWLEVDKAHLPDRAEIKAEVRDQTISIEGQDIDRLTINLDDRFIDLDQSVKLVSEGIVLRDQRFDRTIDNLIRSFEQSGDPNLAFPAAVTIEIPPPFPQSLVPPGEIPTYTATRTSDAIVVDGKLDEPAWTTASKTNRFVDLISGEQVVHDTGAAIVWDNENLYVGFFVTEPNVRAKYTDRDDPIYYDNDVELFIAGDNAYYEFEINPFGTIYEAFFVWDDAIEHPAFRQDPQLAFGIAGSQPFNGVGLTTHPRGPRTAFLGYDMPGLRSAVAIEGTLNNDADMDRGWTVEIAIPWESMRTLLAGDARPLPPKEGDQWRIDLFRFNTDKSAGDSGGWAVGKHAVWDSHIPELFPVVTFQ
jgi:hypothetical protein